MGISELAACRAGGRAHCADGMAVSMRRLVPLLMMAGALVLAAGAAADGDPASDVLLSTDQFTPYPPPSAKVQQSLTDAIDALSGHGAAEPPRRDRRRLLPRRPRQGRGDRLEDRSRLRPEPLQPAAQVCAVP